MPRRAAGLSAQKVKTAAPGRYGDGNGLYLLVRSADARFWVFRYKVAGRMREMGLGRAGADAAAVTLAEARAKAAGLHRLVRGGMDPLEQRTAEAAAAKAAAQAAAARAITFRAVTRFYLDAHEASWRNPKHRQQWSNTLDTYAMPNFGDLPVAIVGTAHVLAALEPIWRTKPETAARVRGRIETVLDYAATREWRSGENPARWRGHIANLLPARGKVAPVEHHAALPWREIAAFVAALRGQAGMARHALEFAVYTAARSGEALGARWGEIDLAAALWTVPPDRMKGAREHRVPLSGAALEVLAQMAPLRPAQGDAYVFPGAQAGKPLSNMAMSMVLRRMGRGDLTVHGFRSAFRDWVGEATTAPREVAEAALAHALGDKTEAAYARGDLFEKRRELMAAWAAFCTQPAAATGGGLTPPGAAA
jgi:integrase